MKSATKRIILLGAIVVLMLLVTHFTNEIQWDEAIAYSVILLAIGGMYETWQWLRTKKATYRFAFCVGFVGALLIGWINGAVGIIGSEDNPANLLYGAVFIVGLIGILISRLRPIGMARTLYATALVQVSIPIVALLVWPATISWGDAGIVGVFIFNFIFVAFFLASAFLFQHAAHDFL